MKKNMVSKIFGAMMPRGSKKLALSKMNMGAKMIRSVMKKNKFLFLRRPHSAECQAYGMPDHGYYSGRAA